LHTCCSFISRCYAADLAYTPPPKTAPRRNVAVRLCSVSCDFGRTLGDPTNSCDGFQKDVADWVLLAKSNGGSTDGAAAAAGGGGRIWAWNYVFHQPLSTPINSHERLLDRLARSVP
jgi:hypothetical protein